jgi:hypothetical protein
VLLASPQGTVPEVIARVVRRPQAIPVDGVARSIKTPEGFALASIDETVME